MSKIDKIKDSPKVSWQDMGDPDQTGGAELVNQIMNVMEQGIIVWSPAGTCELHNTRIFDVLELDRNVLSIGTIRDEFLAWAHARGEFSDEIYAENKRRFENHAAFQFDRTLPSGRIVATYARPTREGGYVVTSTDVTEARRAAEELSAAKGAAEAAEAQARQVLHEERARQVEAHALSDLDQWLQSCKSLEELFEIVSKFLSRLVPDSSGQLYLYSNSRDVLDGACEWGSGTPVKQYITPDSCWSLRRGRTYEYTTDALCFPCGHLGAAERQDPNSYICIPVIAHGDTVGLLHIHFDRTMPSAEVKSMGQFATRCAEHISMAIANVKLRDELHDQSIRDPLTGLYNRRYFMDAMRREASITDCTDMPYGLISFDADHFKLFNDNHGHDAGDQVLLSLSECMQSVMPDDAACARLGGEEFAILVPGQDLETAMATAEMLRQLVERMEVRTANSLLPKVTISSGVACYVGNGTPPSGVLKMADEALYKAKAAGRNCVVASEAEC